MIGLNLRRLKVDEQLGSDNKAGVGREMEDYRHGEFFRTPEPSTSSDNLAFNSLKAILSCWFLMSSSQMHSCKFPNRH
jgi:hypothetical protein